MLFLAVAACTSVDEAPDPVVTQGAVAEVLPAGNGAAAPPAVARTPAPPIDPVITRAGVGFVHHDTDRATLVAKLGEDAIAPITFDQGEGMTMPGLEVLAGTPFALRLQTDGTTVERIEVVGDAYRLDNGLHLGSSFAELREALGPFMIFGYGWDYGGTVVDKGFRPPGYQLAIRTEPAPHDGKRSAAAQAVLGGGDRHFSSTHDGVTELAPQVAAITLVWRAAPKRPQ